jgi:membrane protease YdiL (CAAX protease family)
VEEFNPQVPPVVSEPVISPYPVTSEYFIKPRKPYPSVGAAFGLLGILLGVSVIGGLMLGIVMKLANGMEAPGFMIVYLVAFAITLWLGIIFRRSANFKSVAGAWYLWPLLFAFTALFLIVREPLLQILPQPVADDTDLLSGLNVSNPYIIIVTVFAAPIFEELIFRGMILDGFLKRYKPWTSVILSALIFAIAHISPLPFINAFMLGLLMGWVYWKTGSLWLTIMIHFVNNASASLLAYLYHGEGSSVFQMAGNTQIFWLIYLASLAVVIILFLVIMAVFSEREADIEDAEISGPTL